MSENNRNTASSSNAESERDESFSNNSALSKPVDNSPSGSVSPIALPDECRRVSMDRSESADKSESADRNESAERALLERSEVLDCLERSEVLDCNVSNATVDICKMNLDNSETVGESTSADKREIVVKSLRDDEERSASENGSANEDRSASALGSLSSDLNFSGNAIRFDELPTELLLHIFTYLDASFIVTSLAKVCQSLRRLALDKKTWRVRLSKGSPGTKHPPIPVDDFDWTRACVEQEREKSRWRQPIEDSMDFYQINTCILSAIDSVHLLQEGRLLAAGSRDRHLNIFDLSRFDPAQPNPDTSCCRFTKLNAHGGWIWSITSVDNILATGSWDRFVKFWDLGTLTETSKYRTSSAVLCTHFEAGFLAVGAYDRFVYHIDPRTAGVITKKLYHSKPVLCMSSEDGYIVTGSEDSTVVVYDRRACKVINKVKCNHYPMSMSYFGSELWVGDKAGRLSLFDARHGAFNLVKTFDVGHKFKMTGVIRTDGAVFTSSMDHTMKVLQPGLPPYPISTLAPQSSEIAEITYQNGVLACACSRQCVGVYIPKHYSWN